MRETVSSSVINQPIGTIAEPSAIVKIHKYKRLCEKHHFIPMATMVQSASERDMDRFVKECAYLFHDKQLEGH
jgi:hypothetical protein